MPGLLTPTFGKKGPPILVATDYSLNEHEITVQIDTMFSGTMLIYPTSVEKLELTDAAKTTSKEFFKYTDDGVDMLKTTAPRASARASWLRMLGSTLQRQMCTCPMVCSTAPSATHCLNIRCSRWTFAT